MGQTTWINVSGWYELTGGSAKRYHWYDTSTDSFFPMSLCGFRTQEDVLPAGSGVSDAQKCSRCLRKMEKLGIPDPSP
jgi:hypothetical protein